MTFLIIGIVASLFFIIGTLTCIADIRSFLKIDDSKIYKAWSETQEFFHHQASKELIENLKMLKEQGSDLPKKYITLLDEAEKDPQITLEKIDEREKCIKEILVATGDPSKAVWHHTEELVSFLNERYISSRLQSLRYGIILVIPHLILSILAFSLYFK